MADSTVRVAMIGTAFMGKAHSQAWHTVGRFFDLAARPEAVLLVGSSPETTPARAETLGWQEWSTDWREAVSREDIDLVDICTPGDTHAEIAIAALQAGKHVLCEKPLANSVEEAERMTAAAEEAAARSGVVAMCGFSYRRTPALALARRLIVEGRIGAVRHVRAQYLQDWLSDPRAPHTWRMDKAKAGSGALGDIGAHIIDTAQWLTGDRIESVSAVLRTFVTERPVLSQQVGLGGVGDESAEMRPVTVDDAAAFTASFGSGALGVFEATRMATGRRNANRIEISGDRGAIAFDFERLNELEFYDATDEGAQGFRRIQATDAGNPYADNWWPTGHGLGYENLFSNQAADLLAAISTGGPASPSFAEALDVQRVLAAVEESAAERSVLTAVRRAGS